MDRETVRLHPSPDRAMLRIFSDDAEPALPPTISPDDVFRRLGVGIVAAGELLPSMLIACPVVSVGPAYSLGVVQSDEQLYLTAEWVIDIPHSCQPNVAVIDAVEQIMVRPLRKIPPGERIVRFFPSTEWIISPLVHCPCGEPGCVKALYGAVSLTLDHFQNRPVAPWIRRKLTLKRVYGLK